MKIQNAQFNMDPIADLDPDNPDFGGWVTAKCPHCGVSVTTQEVLMEMFGAPACEACLNQWNEKRKSEAKRRYNPTEADEGPTPQQLFTEQCPAEYSKAINLQLMDAQAYAKSREWKYGEKGLVMIGPSRAGKTRTAWDIVRRAVSNGRNFLFYQSNRFSHAVADASRKGKETEFAQMLLKADIVVWDDLGKFKFTPATESEFFAAVDGRINNLKPCIFTTQYVGETLSEKFRDPHTAEAIVERIREACTPVQFDPGRKASNQTTLAV